MLDLLADWRPGPGPLYLGLASAVRAAIERGDVPFGTRLPAERVLAQRLLVSRTTVVAAYDVLRQEGLVERRQGSGTHVRHHGSNLELAPAGNGRNTLFRRLTEAPDDTIELVSAYLVCTDGLPSWALAGLERDVAALTTGTGYAPFGYPPLRQAIAAHLAAFGVPTVPEQILVTSGGQQGIHLAARLILQPGDTVLVENPTYPGALDAFAPPAHLVWVPTDRSGADVEAIARIVASVNPRLLYVMPTYQNPVGGVMPETRRRALARLIQERQLVTIDDQCLATLAIDPELPPPPIASFAPEAPILTIGSLSKLGWGGLRVGWIRAPEPIVARLARLKAVADLGGSLPGQVIATRMLESFDVLWRERRALVGERFETASALLARLLPSWSWDRPRGGLCLWVRLPRGTAAEFAMVALRHGVSVVPGPIASPSGAFAEYLRLPFGYDPATFEAGVRRLAAAWSAYEPADMPRAQRLEVIV